MESLSDRLPGYIIMNRSLLIADSELAGRALMSAIFPMAGNCKLGAHGATQGCMESTGGQGALLPLAILLEPGVGAAGLADAQQRIAAGRLLRPHRSDLSCGFCRPDAVHTPYGEPGRDGRFPGADSRRRGRPVAGCQMSHGPLTLADEA